MPCRSPPQQITVATQPSPAFLSMSQQSQQQPQLSMAPNGGGGASQQQGSQPKKPGLVARNGYNKQAMEEIRKTLMPYEQADQQPTYRPVSVLSTGSSNGVYSDTVYKDLQLCYDEVSQSYF